MKKVLKMVTGQTAIVILLLAVQIRFFLSTTFAIMSNETYQALNIIIRLISIGVMVYILNKPENPESKLVWMIIIAIVPIIGTVLYLFIQAQDVPVKFNRELKRMRKENMQHLNQSEELLNEVALQDKQKANLIRYMNDHAGMTAYTDTDVTYLPTGEEYWAALLDAINKAERYIFLEYYIIEEGEMWNSILEVLKRKAAEGVDVRLMYDGIGCLTRLDVKYPKKLRKMGIKCYVFNKFKPFLSTIQNNRDHRKIAVVDGHTAITGGVNLSDEYVNITSPFGHWKDTGIFVKGEAAYSFAVMFLELWQICSHQPIVDYNDYRPLNLEPIEQGGIVLPFDDSPMDKEDISETVYIDILTKAADYVHIVTPYLIIDNKMMGALGSAAKSGVDVKIIVPHIADHWYAHAVAKAYYAELITRGVKIYEYMPGFIHGKSFVSDDKTAVVGTINMDYRSLYLHFECGAWIYNHEVVKDIEKDFDDTLKQCQLITLESCKVHGIRRIVYAILRVFAPLM